jgi:pimeloyl-ACP methyl ester carboxylesterase
MRRCGLLLALAALVAAGDASPARGAPEGAEDPYARLLEETRRKLEKTDDPDRAVAALQLLDPQNPLSMPEYLRVLARWHWRVRGAAMDALASVEVPSLRAEMRLHLVSHEDGWVREGVAFAMATRPVPGDGEALVAAMDDREWRVRRTAARALGEIVSKEGVARLVRAVREETDLRVSIWVRASLRAIVREDYGRDARPWEAWWAAHRDKPEWKKQGDEVLRSEFAGVPLERITIDRTPSSEPERKARSKRPELFVLAPFGWTHGWFRPTLDEAAEYLRITYVNLPTVQEVTGQSGFGNSVPSYPVDRLASALDALRAAGGRDRIVLLAAGPAAWIAEKYAMRYRDRVAGLVLVDGWLDAQAYVEALARAARDGTVPQRRAAATLMSPGRRDRDEAADLRRDFLTASLADLRESEAWRLWKEAARDHGFAVVPPLVFDRHVRVEAPTLFYFPDPDVQPLSGGGEEDLRRIRASFRDPTPVIAVVRDGRGLSHVEDPAEFLRVLRGFLEHAGVLQ